MSIGKITHHPLIGKFIKFDTDEGEYFSISRVTADLGDGFLLAQRISPRTGHDLKASHILIVAHLAHDEWTAIYDSWETFEADMKELEDDDDRRILKLVPNGDSKHE